MATASAPGTSRGRKSNQSSGPRLASGNMRGTWPFLIPALIAYGFVVLWPSLQGSVFAFTDWNGLSFSYEFVGFENFVQLTQDPKAMGAVGRTLLIAITVTVVQTLIGLLLALGVNSNIKSRNILRVIFFAPVVITPVAVGYLWKNLYSTRGAINSVLDVFGIDFVSWLGDLNIAIWSICIVVIWQYAGVTMVIILANLQGISPEVIEASHVDGAGPFRRFWSIVRPELAPAFTIVLMLSLIGGLKLFDQVFILTGGGPAGATETLSTLIYSNAFQYGEFAYSAAIALMLTLLVAILSGAQYTALRRQSRV